jgi:glycolate oxidase FAD binding subunit
MSDEPALRRLIDRVLTARDTRTPLCLRGHGSKDFYGEAPRGEPLDMTPLAGITHYEPTELVVTVRAGTPLAELEAVLAAQGQCLAFEPPRFHGYTAGGPTPRGTVGGMVAAGLAGPSRAAVGSVRDFVLGAALLDARGEVLRFGGEVMKNVAGYDVARVLAGSLGILGPIVEVSLKVLPQPPARTTLRFEWHQPRALQQLQQWAAQPLPLRASAWWNDTLLVQLAGAEAAVRAATQAMGGERIEPAAAEAFWSELRDQRDEFFTAAVDAVHSGATLWRISLAATAPPLPLEGEQLIEWGGALRWLVNRADAAVVRGLAAQHGGHATEFRGAKRSGVFAPLAPPLARIHRELKARFDPERLFNPGRLYPDL